ncbi:V-type ATP synthase subunit I [Sneathia sp. DSM 16631]|uniref:V-type ATP synthase subunit I n=1 Tax=Sneathia TaxID=168808 RepID=UPI0018676DFF|nr:MULTISPECIES: V-type ATP synthase subunit I [Sneathia]MBE3031360.1 V-type ATP synthase subunit I [Sneathia sp. DSM 16631]MDK9582440.1 V-type ATP synthase subunit I [Sneathia vaginalis]
MAILNMSRFNLIVFEHDKKEILNSLQNFREVDFRQSDIKEFGYDNFLSSDIEGIEDNIFKLDQVIKKLRKYEKAKGALKSLKDGQKTFTYSELKEFTKNHDFKKVVDEVTKLQFDYDANLKTIENARIKIQDYTPLLELDISNKEIHSLKQVFCNIGMIPTKYLSNLENDEIYYEVINKTVKESLVCIVSKNNNKDLVKEILRKSNFNKLSLSLEKKPCEYIEEFNKEIEEKTNLNNDIVEKFKQYADDIEDLEVCYEYYCNEKLREIKSEGFGKTDELVVLEGFIPTEKENEFKKQIEDVCSNYYYLTMEKVAKTSNDAPIKLKNGKFSDAFEGLVKTYSMPSYNEIDPTPLVAPFYWLFFGMMVADFGYGLLVTILSGLVLKTCNLKEAMRKNVKFFFYLGFSIMLWGAIYGSYFSLPLGIPGLINPTTDYNTILKLSIVIGLIHVFVGLGAKAYMQIRDGKPLDAFYDVGLWYLTLTTVILLLLGKYMGFNPIAMKVIKYIMILSMIGIILTGGREVKNIGGRIGLGIYSLYGISGYMGDLISYARLMALGLSGGFIALSVNQICAMVGFKPATIIFVIIIFVFGQTFNILLSLLGAYVHSARLIYVEFFGKFYEGGGKEFKDFKIDEKYINIKEDK